MHGPGGNAWWGACMAWGQVWSGVCMAREVWVALGVCVAAGGTCAQGHARQWGHPYPGGALMTGKATAAVSTRQCNPMRPNLTLPLGVFKALVPSLYQPKHLIFPLLLHLKEAEAVLSGIKPLEIRRPPW